VASVGVFMTTVSPRLKRLCHVNSLIEGQLLVDHLLAHKLTVFLHHSHVQGAIGELPFTYPEVWLRNDREEQSAVALVDSFFQSEQTPRAEIICPRCAENNPGNFEVCWHCQAALD
jgi:hypothetical protein